LKKHILMTLTIACAIFIYSNSLMNADISSSHSGFFLHTIQNITETLGIPSLLLTEHLIRKLAHFCEYALLGFLITSTIHAWRDKIKPHTYMLLFWCLLIPLSDESLQLFVDGRAGMVQDVLLDFGGSIFGILFYVGISLLLHISRKEKHES
jgi:VanZ family protein